MGTLHPVPDGNGELGPIKVLSKTEIVVPPVISLEIMMVGSSCNCAALGI
ncbi:MAG: hypothetical protein HN366_24405 [Deltaproteobacteria bacterium]|nr:hypothetical protein [Deltaproteobacteria bacterium]